MKEKALDLKAIESLVRQSMSEAKAQGIKIEPKHYGVKYNPETSKWSSYKSICPLGALILKVQPLPVYGNTIEMTAQLSVSEWLKVGTSWTYAFSMAFDHKHHSAHDACDLGKKFRSEVDAGMWS